MSPSLHHQPPLAKVLVVGASETGKTSLINRFVFREFIAVEPTIGVNFAQKVVKGKDGTLNLSIWDLSGRPRFRFLMPRFCAGAAGVLLVYDVSRPSTLAEAAQWLKLVSSNPGQTEPPVVVLVGSKSDLPCCVPLQEVKSFCSSYGIKRFIQCSAKSGHNVDLVFETLCSALQQVLPQQATAPPHTA